MEPDLHLRIFASKKRNPCIHILYIMDAPVCMAAFTFSMPAKIGQQDIVSHPAVNIGIRNAHRAVLIQTMEKYHRIPGS